MNELDRRRIELERELATVEERFTREMRARGFDPKQADNVPLSNELAQLYGARAKLLDQLEQLEDERE